MKILQINAFYGMGSTGIIVEEIGKLIEKNGDVPYFAYQKGPKKLKNSYLFNNKVDRYCHALYTRVFGKQAYASRFETRKFLNWVDKIKPDVVHLHNLHSNYINLNMLLKYLAKKDIATVITMHDCWYFTGKCTHYVQSNCNKWQSFCGDCPQKHQAINSLFFDRSKKVLKDKLNYLSSIKKLKIVGCSNWIAGEARKSTVLKNKDITVIRNGIDTNVFKPTKKTFKKEKNLNGNFIILGFANKWCDELNKATVNYILNHLGNSEKVVLIGCSNENKEKFENNKNVICLGLIKDRKKLADIYSSADVFVNLTHADTLPTVNMESICCGTPVITFNVTGSPELVDRNSGFTVKENDYKELLNKVRFIKENGFNIDMKVYKDKFDKNKCFSKYITLYSGILG